MQKPLATLYLHTSPDAEFLYVKEWAWDHEQGNWALASKSGWLPFTQGDNLGGERGQHRQVRPVDLAALHGRRRQVPGRLGRQRRQAHHQPQRGPAALHQLCQSLRTALGGRPARPVPPADVGRPPGPLCPGHRVRRRRPLRLEAALRLPAPPLEQRHRRWPAG